MLDLLIEKKDWLYLEKLQAKGGSFQFKYHQPTDLTQSIGKKKPPKTKNSKSGTNGSSTGIPVVKLESKRNGSHSLATNAASVNFDADEEMIASTELPSEEGRIVRAYALNKAETSKWIKERAEVDALTHEF